MGEGGLGWEGYDDYRIGGIVIFSSILFLWWGNGVFGIVIKMYNNNNMELKEGMVRRKEVVWNELENKGRRWERWSSDWLDGYRDAVMDAEENLAAGDMWSGDKKCYEVETWLGRVDVGLMFEARRGVVKRMPWMIVVVVFESEVEYVEYKRLWEEWECIIREEQRYAREN